MAKDRTRTDQTVSDYPPWKTENRFEVLLFFSNILFGCRQKMFLQGFQCCLKMTKIGGRQTEEILLGKPNGK